MGTEVEVPAELAATEFEIVARRLADALVHGEDRSSYVGRGVDFAQSRPFVDGDPIKAIDWRVTARTGRVHVKEFETPKRMPVQLVVDTSASMAVSSTPLSKHRLAVAVCAALGFAALARQSPVGIVSAGTRAVRMPPSLLRSHVLRGAERLRRAGLDEGTTLARRLDETCAFSGARSVIIVLSDFHDPLAHDAIRRAAQAHDLVALQLVDPAERGVLGGGIVRGREAETGRAVTFRGRTRWAPDVRDGDDLAARLRRAGVDHLVIHTDRPFVGALRRLLRERGLLGRNAR